jgi:hypothetical protein
MSNAESVAAAASSDIQPSSDSLAHYRSASRNGSQSGSPQLPPAIPSEPQAQSQPMTATASTSSLQPPVENGDNPASGYGTRSRNRTGGRPNYAEDKEMDLEIEALSKPSRSSKRAAGASTEQQPAPSAFASVNGATPSDRPADSATAAPTTPVPTPAPSKKRKHPGSNNTVAANSGPTNTSRAKAASSVPFKGYVETNMMSFSRCGYKLNAMEQLVADDGTTVQANGKKSFF